MLDIKIDMNRHIIFLLILKRMRCSYEREIPEVILIRSNMSRGYSRYKLKTKQTFELNSKSFFYMMT
jgi:hypothetical protein